MRLTAGIAFTEKKGIAQIIHRRIELPFQMVRLELPIAMSLAAIYDNSLILSITDIFPLVGNINLAKMLHDQSFCKRRHKAKTPHRISGRGTC